jgi:hypothetical protein
MNERRLRWPHVVPAGWFVLVVVAGGLITYLQESLGGVQIPVQSAARALLVAEVLIALAVSHRASRALPPSLSFPLGLFILSAVVALAAAAGRGTPTSDAVGAFMFMYGTGVLLAVFLIAPVSVRLGLAFRAFCVVAVGFGLLQTYKQDLLLPVAFRDRFGIVYERFVNENVRVLSFFASPPRFAELLVLIAAFIQHGFITGRRRGPASVLGYLLVVFVLYNTFSRSGYVLFLSTLIVQMFLMRRKFLGSDGASRVRLYMVLVLLCGGMAMLVSGRLPFDSSVVDTTSFTARQGHWSLLYQQAQGLSVSELFVGTGTSARFSVLSNDYFVVDNILLAVLLYSGLFGLLCFLFLFARIAREGVRAIGGGEARWEAILAFYISLLVEGMFVDNHNTIFTVQFALIGMLVWNRLSQAPVEAGDGDASQDPTAILVEPASSLSRRKEWS